ncbi:hypothetical protein MICAG_2610020 [Microcystis aeruginosa PCC 9808]|uniref:Uncharacterized protein n=1 Tax=Microcystis aeruginosa PCC 9808 TaxID=1160284 RepID=I4HS30_MICAE|nr:hypothetical protein MICAG_2610020 [Microcystis aeruginosa PCC 9808]
MTPGFIAKWKKEFISAGIEGIILKYKGSRPRDPTSGSISLVQ